VTRREQLLDLVGEDIKAGTLVDEILFLEEQMAELKKLPFIIVNKNNPAQQKATPASKQYKEMLQQYNNSVRLLVKITEGDGESENESPLRKWARERKA
jgi:hypothetical protein